MINKDQKKFLLTRTHALNPVVWIGQNGLSENVLQELNMALDHHELIKIKIRMGDRQLRDKLIEEISLQTKAEQIQKIGNIIVLYRQNREEPVIKLP